MTTQQKDNIMEFLAIAAIVLGVLFTLAVFGGVIFVFRMVYKGFKRTEQAFEDTPWRSTRRG